jgi:hypothetical protein
MVKPYTMHCIFIKEGHFFDRIAARPHHFLIGIIEFLRFQFTRRHLDERVNRNTKIEMLKILMNTFLLKVSKI